MGREGMNLGKCCRCNKTCYQMEGYKYGPPGNEQVVHKACFVCQNEGCTWKLDMRTYHFYEGKTYCKNHNPMTGFSNSVQAKGHFTATKDMAQQMEDQKLRESEQRVNANIVSPRGPPGSGAGANSNSQTFF